MINAAVALVVCLLYSVPFSLCDPSRCSDVDISQGCDLGGYVGLRSPAHVDGAGALHVSSAKSKRAHAPDKIGERSNVRKEMLALGSTVAAAVLLVSGAATPAYAATYSCSSGHVCFYTGRDGTGKVCTWSAADPDWTSGSIVCSWATTTNVASIFNNGTSSNLTGVVYYKSKDYQNRAGCTKQGGTGNLAGTYKVLSHRWTDGYCG